MLAMTAVGNQLGKWFFCKNIYKHLTNTSKTTIELYRKYHRILGQYWASIAILCQYWPQYPVLLGSIFYRNGLVCFV